MNNVYKSLMIGLLSVCLIACSGGQVADNKAGYQPANNTSGSNTTSGTSNSIYPDYNQSPLPVDSIGMDKNAQQIANEMNLGWNIGNTLEATGGETAWGNPKVTSELIQLVKDSGFDAIRIPVSWDQYADQDTAEIDLSWLDRVKEVVQYCLDHDLYVVINIHWDGGWLEEHITPEHQDAVNAKQKAYWQQIASYFRDFDQRLLFASGNEPAVETAEQMEVLDSYHQTFVTSVRETGGKNAYRVLILQGPKTDIELTNDLWTGLPQDSVTDRIMAEVHFYTPYNFTLMNEDESWGNQFYYWGEGYHSETEPERNATWGEEEHVDAMMALMKVKFVDKGIPVVLGEFAAMRRTNLTDDALELHLASRAYYSEYVVQQATAAGLIPFFWDNGALDHQGTGIFNRHSNEIFDQTIVDALIRGVENGR